jgi:VWFA-related protein
MRNTAKLLLAGVFATLLIAGGTARHGLSAQAPQQTPAPPTPAGQPFRTSADLVLNHVTVRDRKSQFLPDLKESDFEVYEDGVRQKVSSFSLIHGGRTFNTTAAPIASTREGLLLPRNRPTSDASGRIFVLFIDDAHLDFRTTPKTREILKKISKDLIHDNDMFAIVTTGTSSVAQQLTYDKQILEAAISRITGGALRPSEILQSTFSSQGPMEVRHRAHVTFETMNDLLTNLQKVQNKRKAILYLSSGYDFNPFEKARFEDLQEKTKMTAEQLTFDPFQITQDGQMMLNETDLHHELTYITRQAQRANATIYTIDPRGLVAGQDVDEELPYEDWLDWIRETQMGLRVLAEETGGIAVVNQNDFDKALKQIDSEMSDYYLIGFYSSNPDPLKRRRTLSIKVTGRSDLTIEHRPDYVLPPLPRPDTQRRVLPPPPARPR